MKIHTKQTGFNLIETLILVGILAPVVYFGYSIIRDHRVRGLVVYASLYARDIETEMNAYFKHHGKFPPDLEAVGISDIEQLV